jgi:hypothetical protein
MFEIAKTPWILYQEVYLTSSVRNTMFFLNNNKAMKVLVFLTIFKVNTSILFNALEIVERNKEIYSVSFSFQIKL